MDERAALRLVGDLVGAAGDDAAVVDSTVLTIDMLHERTDFPDGTTRYTAGWRSVGASLSDVAAMGADATAAVAVYGAPEFDEELERFVGGAIDVCERVDAEYVGGDLDDTDELTVATAALGETDDAVGRSGARPGDALCVTGTLGRTPAALDCFAAGDAERGNELFRFTPRVAAGVALRERATAMIDSSDGLARSVHQLAEASDCGFALDSSSIPVAPELRETTPDADEAFERAVTTGEDFELVCTLPEDAVEEVRGALDVSLSVVGAVTDGSGGAESGITLDGDPLPDRGYTHGSD